MKIQDIRKFISKNRIAVFITVFILLISSGTVYATYLSKSGGKKGYVSTQESDSPFSSNYLSKISLNASIESYSQRIFAASVIGTTKIRICNYQIDNMTVINSDDILYSMKFRLVDKSGNPVNSETMFDGVRKADLSNYKIRFEGNEYTFDQNGECIISYDQEKEKPKLCKNSAQTDIFELDVDDDLIQYINVSVEAVPETVSENAAANQKLSSVFSFMHSSSNVDGWKGRFVDSRIATPKVLDGFNYEISGSGETKVSLLWNTDYVDISPVFLSDLQNEADALNSSGTSVSFDITSKDKIKTLTFDAGRLGQSEIYLIQFYRTNGIPENEVYDSSAGLKCNSDIYIQFG